METFRTKLDIACKNTVESLQRNMAKLKTDKANPAMVEDIKADYYGAPTPIRQMASVTVSGGNTIVVAPWEAQHIKAIEKAIAHSGLGLTPTNDGNVVRMTVPPLTVQRGQELAKVVKEYGEQARVGIRGHRKEANDYIKQQKKDGEYDEAVVKYMTESVQGIVDSYIRCIDDLIQNKIKDFTEFSSSVGDVMRKERKK